MDIIQFMSPHLWMYTQRRDHCHPKPLVVPISRCLFRGANFTVPISRRKFCGANFAAQILRRKFCDANFAGFAGYTILSIWQNTKSRFEPVSKACLDMMSFPGPTLNLSKYRDIISSGPVAALCLPFGRSHIHAGHITVLTYSSSTESALLECVETLVFKV